MSFENICIGCMEDKGEETVCPHCQYEEEEYSIEASLYLKPRTILADKYMIGRVLGQGGFGITYLSWDLNLELKLAVKEFFPQGLVTRLSGKQVVSYTGDIRSQFNYGIEKFLSEAKTLARFEHHPNIVTVRDFFKENGTAYMVMSYVEGVTFEEYFKQEGGEISYERAFDIMMPAMDALKEVHKAGIMHRDISPDNICIDSNGRVILIDFGAARHELQGKSKSLSVILKVGYAPEEQYRSRGEQGPWSDVYATAATMYRAITGITPPESMDRMRSDTLLLPSELGINISKQQESVIIKALAVNAEDRYRTVSEFQEALCDAQTRIEEAPKKMEPEAGKRIITEPQKNESSTSWPKISILLAGILLVALIIIGSVVLINRSNDVTLPTDELVVDQTVTSNENIISFPGNGITETIEVEIVNETDNVVIAYALLYGPSIDEWGEELLVDDFIEPGELFTFILPENNNALILMTHEYYVVSVIRNVSKNQRFMIGGDGKIPVLVVNKTEVDVGTVFISSVELEVWGNDLLGGEVIPAGLGKFFFVEPGIYDFMSQDISGEIVALDTEIEITQETTFTIVPPEP